MNYTARKGDTVGRLATTLGIKPSEITALNKDLQANFKLVVGKTYKLPARAAAASMTAVSDIQIEYYARHIEAGRALRD
ncbi:hypothetical protein H2198_007745 [Neophaeococcomyces mojaviensis]|uniref:Uncharacterized protein n=1 Tax=Neophaeococcomyces mojaviensis TaxID=3383035 RepID=A0ACC2ZZ69_9EURO|nr:hypothetical protein H2198_007745 [Knufia sp. JES_112]